MPRLVCISDTHGMHKKIKLPDGDILAVAGDVTMRGDLDEVLRFTEWVDTLLNKGKFKDVVWICGNHDFLFQDNPALAKESVKLAGTYLQDTEATIQGLRFYGTPWQPEFFDWAFNLPRGNALKIMWDRIPAGIDVLITHGPPYKILDNIYRKNRTRYDDPNLQMGHVGCYDLAHQVVNRIKPKVHVFGHIHEAYGMVEQDGIKFVNAATCTYHYDPINKPLVVDI